MKHDLFVWGIHPVLDAISSAHVAVHEIFLSSRDPALENSIRGKTSGKISIQKMEGERLSQKIGSDHHQGIGARVSIETFDRLEDLLGSGHLPKPATFLALDQIQDPQNSGSLFRSARFFGISGVILTRDRSAPISGAVAKVSTGGLFQVPIVSCANLARELEECEELDVYRVGLDANEGELLENLSFPNQHLMLVVGNEEKGLRDLTKKRCDYLARLSLDGKSDSLNAAVAGAIALYEIMKKRPKS